MKIIFQAFLQGDFHNILKNNTSKTEIIKIRGVLVWINSQLLMPTAIP